MLLLRMIIVLACGCLLACSLNDRNLEIVKRKWVDAGRPQKPDWDQLLAGLGPDMK